MTEDQRWLAVLRRNRAFDGVFVYAVRTTGIYCRPSCASRKPRRHNVRFFAVPEAAETQGYRPCERCRPAEVQVGDPQVAMVRRACREIEGSPAGETPKLEELAGRLGVSPGHLHRTFKRLVGVTPREFAEAGRVATLKSELRRTGQVTRAQYEAGLSSSSRLYERARSHLGMTPAVYSRGGEGQPITYGVVRSSLGWLLVAATRRGVCAVKLGDGAEQLERELTDEFSRATVTRDDRELEPFLSAVVASVESGSKSELPLDIRATAFQWKVWKLLQDIPVGETRTYGELARALGVPRAAQAVGRACATNPAAVIIPCHRIVREDGSVGGYRWGIERKRKLLERESRVAALEDRYALVEEIGEGHVATVYLAQDRKHDRRVAVKVLRPELVASLEAERFAREIAIAARLEHPHLVPVLDFGDAGGMLFYVMPYVTGATLRERLRGNGALSWEDAVRLVVQIAGALHHAHRSGVVHRDVKPENILLSEGDALLSDFGLARAVASSADHNLTQPGASLGTPAYMSPEQAAGDADVDHRSDIYSLGVVLYELIAGRPPVQGSDTRAILLKTIAGPVPDLGLCPPGVPRVVRDAIRKSLARERAERFDSAEEFAEALGQRPAASDQLAGSRSLVAGNRSPAAPPLIARRLP